MTGRRLEGVDVTPEGLVEYWKDRYTEFWPKGSHLYQPSDGLEEGDTAAADLAMIGGTRVGTGIRVIDEQPTSFTFATLDPSSAMMNFTVVPVRSTGVPAGASSVTEKSGERSPRLIKKDIRTLVLKK